MDNGTKSYISTKQNLEEEARFISAAIEKHGIKYIKESKSMELLAAIIYNKYLKKSAGLSQNNNKNADDSSSVSRAVLNIFYTLLIMVFIIFSILIMLGYDLKSMFTPSMSKNSNASIVAGNFEFMTGDNLSKNEFFGQERLLQDWKNIIIRCIRDINSGRSRLDLETQNIGKKMNFALFGIPGTGKTFFVQYLTRIIDFELKKAHFILTKKKEYLELLEKNDENSNAFKEFINALPSRTRFCEVSPGKVNGKYVGESENNIRLVFDTARNTVDQSLKVCVLFFDEGDVFFNERKGSDDAGNRSALNVKSELLTRLSGPTMQEYKPVFVFTATNKMTEFDDAFKRRFDNQHEFTVLDYPDRIRFFAFLLKDFDLTEKDFILLATYTANKSQSYIADKMSKFIIFDYNQGSKRFLFREYVDFLKDNLNSENML